MKKFILSLFALVGVAGTVSAQDVKLTVADVDAAPGQTVTATLNFECPADKYTGMQIWLTFDPVEGISVADAGAVTGAEGVKYSFKDGTVNYAYGLDATFTSSTMSVAFTVDESVEVGSVFTVNVTGQLEGYGVDDAPVTGSFKVNVNSYITLDENALAAPKATTSKVDVVLKRTFKADEWSTICVPFALNATLLKAAFGEDVTYELGQIEGLDVEKDGDRITGLKVNFKTVAGARANTPLIIKVSKNVSETRIFNTQVSPSTTLSLPITVTDEETFEDVVVCSMTGTYVAQTVVPEKSLFLSENKFWYSTGKTKMNAYRAYFTLKDVLSSYAASSDVRFYVSDGDSQTEIQIPELMPNDGEYYNLNGLRVDTPSKGIYIKNGKKVVVK